MIKNEPSPFNKILIKTKVGPKPPDFTNSHLIKSTIKSNSNKVNAIGNVKIIKYTLATLAPNSS